MPLVRKRSFLSFPYVCPEPVLVKSCIYIEMTLKDRFFTFDPVVHPGLRKTAFLSHLYIKTIILPRQARDKHRENSKKDAVFRTCRKRVPLSEIPFMFVPSPSW
jgi:hypothetical protein